jgi:endonuclease/exonuclease/phosphatase family metal-dependent hydrolase
MVRVLSYNIHFGRRLEEILDWLAGEPSPDLICFQEFPKHKISFCIRALAKSSYGYRFAPSLGSGKNKEYGVLTLFRKNILHPVSFRRVAIGGNILEKAWFKGNISRHTLVTVFRHRETTLVLVNIHLVSSAPNSHRYRQINTIIRALHQYPHPVVIAGDFNIPDIMGKRKLIRLMKNNLYQTDEKRMSTHRIAGIHTQVDYVFWKDCTVRTIRALKVRYSDHYPVRFTMSFKSASRLHVARHTRVSAAP